MRIHPLSRASARRHGARIGVVAIASFVLLGSVAAAAPCSRAHRQPRAVAGSGLTPAAAAYAVLERPRTSEDGAQLLRRPLSELDGLGSELIGFSEYDLSAIRKLGSSGRATYYYVPGRRANLFSQACLRKLSPSNRRLARAFAHAYPAGPGYCIVEVVEGEAGTLACGTLGAAPAGYAFGVSTSTGANDVLVGLVPDGVASVQIAYGHGVSSAGTVAGNLFIAPAPPVAAREVSCKRSNTASQCLRSIRAAIPASVSWLDSTGAPLQQFVASSSYLRDAELTDGLTTPAVQT